jgi:hypothetical protein
LSETEVGDRLRLFRAQNKRDQMPQPKKLILLDFLELFTYVG